MAWDHRYRMLQEGERIRRGDQCMTDSHRGWQPAGLTVGKRAPSPMHTAHRIYRRMTWCGWLVDWRTWVAGWIVLVIVWVVLLVT